MTAERDPEACVTGGCPCGAVRFEADLPSKFACHCHCENCRRAHGAGVVTWVGFPRDGFRLVAGADRLTRFRTDTNATRTFCSRCGATLLYESPRWPDDVHVALAHLHGELDRAPSAHVYADRAPSWCPITDDLPRHGGPSGTEPLD